MPKSIPLALELASAKLVNSIWVVILEDEILWIVGQ
jgi:hypothetical protein